MKIGDRVSNRRDLKITVVGFLMAVALTFGGCGGEEGDALDISEAEQALLQDLDLDGIDDAYEDHLAAKFAPVLRLAPAAYDWTRPASVAWYLSRVELRFDHGGGCPDTKLLSVGAVTQTNMSQQNHRQVYGLPFCAHYEPPLYSKNNRQEFFLQPPDDAVHRGITTNGVGGLWTAYVHVRPQAATSLLPAGYSIQFWFFYPYNDGYGSVNHEGDWEHVNVFVDQAEQVAKVYLSQHDTGTLYAPSGLGWSGTHPVVYVADGSHANYPSAGAFHVPGTADLVHDHTYEGGPVWSTAASFVNVGERNKPLNGQTFILYGGRWGEIGTVSGPQGPTFQSRWATY